MKRKIKLMLLAALGLMIIIYCTAYSVINYEFSVLAVSGKVEYRGASETKWEKLNIGMHLDSDSKVRLGDKSYLGLVHRSGRTKEIKTKGTFQVSELSNNINGEYKPTLQRLADYILISIIGSERKNEDNVKKSLSKAATVERGLLNTIESEFPKSTRLNSTTVTFFWKPLRSGLNYSFSISDDNNNDIYNKSVNTSSIKVDLKALKLDPQRDYFWSVKPGNNSSLASKQFSFRILPEDQETIINRELVELRNDLNPKSSLDNLLLSGFYDFHGLFYDSYLIQKKIKESNPRNKIFADYFKNWINEHSIVSEK